MKNTSLLVGVILLGSIGTLLGGPLQEAKINQIVNDVKVVDPQKGARPAVVQDTVRDQIAVRTGIQSRAELLFQDATLTRLGAETFFSFKAGTRDLTLEKGTMLLQVPKNRGGARIRTASVTASITGTTIMIEHLPGSSLKVLVLEGSLRLSVNGRFGESISLKPGKMIIMEANAKKLPNPVDVDLRKVVKTSALVDPQLFKGKSRATVAALPSMALIDREIALQAGKIAAKGLVPTNLVIAGKGTSVIAASDEAMADLEKRAGSRGDLAVTPIVMAQATADRRTRTTATEESPNSGGDASTGGSAAAQNVSNIVNTIAAGTIPQAMTSGSGSGSGSGSSGSSVIQSIVNSGTSGTAATTPTTPPTTPTTPPTTPTTPPTTPPITVTSPFDLQVGPNTFTFGKIKVVGAIVPTGGVVSSPFLYQIAAYEIEAGNGLRFIGADGTATTNPHAGGYLGYLYAKEIKFTPSRINGANLMGGAAVTGAGGDGGHLWIGSFSNPIPGAIEFNVPVTVSSGANGTGTPTGGAGGSVFAHSKYTIKVASTIKASDSAPGVASARGGSIILNGKKTSSTAIQITNSGQLLALLDAAAPGPGGTIRVTSSGGKIDVDGGRIQADRGSVELNNSGLSGNITLKNSDIRGDTVKIGAIGANGQLVIGGGTINADSTLKLYGGTTNGQVRFIDNVTLGGAGTKSIASKSVTIDNGKTVTIGGSAPANVYTSNPNYTGSGGNGSRTGTFGGQGAVTQPLGNRPAF